MTALNKELTKCVMVTGGTGFIGSHIAEELLIGKVRTSCRHVVVYDDMNLNILQSSQSQSQEQKYNLTTLKETAKKYRTTLTIVNGDLRDQQKITETIQKYGVTACIHLGGMNMSMDMNTNTDTMNLEECIDINVRGTALLLDALGKCGVEMVVQASNHSVFGIGNGKGNNSKLDEDADRKPVDIVGACKVGTDAMAHCYSHLHTNMNMTLLRIFGGVYGPSMVPCTLIDNLINDKPFQKVGNGDDDGKATCTWTYISDIVSAFVMALENPQRGFAEFHIGAPSSTTLNEMIACAEQVTEKKAMIKKHSNSTPLGDIHSYGHGHGHPSYARIEKVIGWTPKVDIAEGMRLTYEAYMAKRNSSLVNAGCFGN